MKISRTYSAIGLCAMTAITFGQASSKNMVEVSGFVPNGVTSAKPLGLKSGSDILHLAIGVKPANLPGLESFVNSVSDPKSPTYRHFLTPDKIGQIYGLPMTHIQRIVNYLTSNGMTIKEIAKSRFTILADATVAQASAAFGTSFENYAVTTPAQGTDSSYFCFTTPPAVPSTISADVQSISGVQNFIRPHRNAPIYYTPQQFQTAYTAPSQSNSAYQGQGRTIGISNWDGFNLENAAVFEDYWGLPEPTNGWGTNITVETIDGGSESHTAGGEGDLDQQASVGMAPLANIIVYDGNGSDLINVLTQQSDKNECDIITMSYGWNYDGDSADVITLHSLMLTMSGDGITYMAASGDHGTSISDYDYPDIEPEVLSVGGTSLQLNSNNQRSSEVGWNSDGDAGGGGWVVTSDASNVLPSYQKGTGVPTNIPYRLTPDISFDADPNFGYFVVVEVLSTEFYYSIIGGTSGASPNCAGSLAVSEQELIAQGHLTKDANGNYRFGRIQDLLYSFNGNPNIFYDITSGTNGTLPNNTTSNATVGWDTDSGWGPIIWSGFVASFATPEVTSVALNPSTVIGNYGSTGTVTLSEPAQSGGSTVNLSGQISGQVSFPSSVTVAAGATTATFAITTTGLPTSAYTATVTAKLGDSVSATLTVDPEKVSGLSLNPTTIGGLGTSTGTVTLLNPAPPGGWAVGLHAGASGYLNMPSSVTVPAGATSTTFTITGTAQRPATINMGVFASDNTSSQEQVLTIQGDSLKSFTLSPSQIKWTSGTATATLTIGSAAPPGGWNVTLTPGVSGYVNMPTSITIPAGSTSTTFSITGNELRFFTLNLGITASDGGSKATATLVIAGDAVKSITLSPSTIGWGGTSTATVNLVVAAPPGGWLVSTNPGASGYVTMPTSITVPAGATSATFTVTAGSQRSSNLSIGIYAHDGPSNQSATLTIEGDSVKSLTLNPSSITWTNSSTATVTLASPAPPGGWALTIHAGASGYVTMPSTLTVPAGATTATFTITAGSQRSSTINLGIFVSDGNSSQEAILTIT